MIIIVNHYESSIYLYLLLYNPRAQAALARWRARLGGAGALGPAHRPVLLVSCPLALLPVSSRTPRT